MDKLNPQPFAALPFSSLLSMYQTIAPIASTAAIMKRKNHISSCIVYSSTFLNIKIPIANVTKNKMPATSVRERLILPITICPSITMLTRYSPIFARLSARYSRWRLLSFMFLHSLLRICKCFVRRFEV